MTASDQLPRSCAIRLGKFSETNRIYLVTAVTAGRVPLFKRFDAGRILVHATRFEERRKRARTLAYVVMPDHFHWLLELGETASLSRVVQQSKISPLEKLIGS